MKKKIKKYMPLLLFLILFTAGLLVMLYPVISNAISEMQYDHVISNYQSTVNESKNIGFTDMLRRASDYNKLLSASSIVDAFSDKEIQNSDEYIGILNIDQNGTMGYISIPKIDVKIPIYHGTSARILQKGVGHLEGSSFPIGGDSTHSILSAHRGLPSAKLFTDLDQLVKGDMFYIHILDQVFTYQVDQVLVIDPSNTEPLRIQEGKDYVTLVTCTPYAVNTHRLLVRGTRIMPEKTPEKIEIKRKMIFSDFMFYTGIGIGIIVFAITVIIVRRLVKKNVHLETNASTDDDSIVELI